MLSSFLLCVKKQKMCAVVGKPAGNTGSRCCWHSSLAPAQTPGSPFLAARASAASQTVTRQKQITHSLTDTDTAQICTRARVAQYAHVRISVHVCIRAHTNTNANALNTNTHAKDTQTHTCSRVNKYQRVHKSRHTYAHTHARSHTHTHPHSSLK